MRASRAVVADASRFAVRCHDCEPAGSCSSGDGIAVEVELMNSITTSGALASSANSGAVRAGRGPLFPAGLPGSPPMRRAA